MKELARLALYRLERMGGFVFRSLIDFIQSR